MLQSLDPLLACRQPQGGKREGYCGQSAVPGVYQIAHLGPRDGGHSTVAFVGDHRGPELLLATCADHQDEQAAHTCLTRTLGLLARGTLAPVARSTMEQQRFSIAHWKFRQPDSCGAPSAHSR